MHPGIELILGTPLQTHSVWLPGYVCPRVPGCIPWGGVGAGPSNLDHHFLEWKYDKNFEGIFAIVD